MKKEHLSSLICQVILATNALNMCKPSRLWEGIWLACVGSGPLEDESWYCIAAKPFTHREPKC